jgi:hypothetical protein
VPAADLELVLPNITRFYVPGSSQPPVGFLGAGGAGGAGAGTGTSGSGPGSLNPSPRRRPLRPLGRSRNT